MDRINNRTDKRANHMIKWTEICKLLIFALTVLQLAGCVKDDLYNTPHPDKGAVKVTTDWSAASAETILPENYILRVGSQEQTVSGQINAFCTLFPPGSRDLLVYHLPEGITVSGTTATVNTLPNGTLAPLPGYLFSGAETLDIVKDDTLQVTVKMEQRIRELALNLNLKPGDEQRIASVSATLTGIAYDIRLTDGSIVSVEGKTIAPAFMIETGRGGTRAARQQMLTASLHLIGTVAEERQVLTLILTLTDGYVKTITTDLTQWLKGFGTGSMEPLTLDADLELPVKVGVNATISDWTVVDNGKIDVH